MPFRIEKINPLDLQSRKAVGISLPFNGQAIFNSTLTTKDAIKTNIVNYLLTAQGERFLNPSFGSSIRKYIFSSIDNNQLVEIRELIVNDLELYFPRVIVVDLSIEAQPDNNTINFYIRYQISDSNIEDEILINFET